MVDFVLGRLRFKFQGEWATSTAYIRDDIVTYGGRSYVCLTNHTSDASSSGGFYTDIDTNSYWELMNDGSAWIGPWATSTWYKLQDTVKYGGRVYICVEGHTSSATAAGGFYTDADTNGYWEMLGDGIEFKGSWAGGTYYKINDIVKWGADLYICNTGHTADSDWTVTESNFTLFVGGLEFEDSYSDATLYQPGDVVRYGGYNFVATNETEGNLPTNTLYWDVLSTGFNHEGVYDNGTDYQPGDVVRYGAYTYVAKVDSTGNLPTNTTYWNLLNTGSRWLGDYNGATAYVPGDMVKYGGYLYIADVDTTGNAPYDTDYWTLHTTGFKWQGTYNSGTTYQLGDVVLYQGSSWICTDDDNVGNTPNSSSSTPWQILAQGDATNVVVDAGDIIYQDVGGLNNLGIGSNGQVLTVSTNGIPQWATELSGNNVFYVSPEGTDASGYGETLYAPFASIKYATENTPNNSVIFVKAGTYTETLPITVPPGTSIIGDSQRTVIVQPDTGYSGAGNTMWLLSDKTLLKQMTFIGMTGFTAGADPEDITDATLGGVFIRFNPDSPILTKSPYVLECSAISTGGIGVIVDGSVHASGSKSMVFHAYTNINNDGVGYWIKDNGRAEIVSCFTYFCMFGLATSGGGFIRGLNNNNSYGKYGAVSRGYDAGETTLDGYLIGEQLQLADGSSTMAFDVGETITGGTSSATGTVLNVQTAANKLYYVPTSGTFANSEVITGGTTSTTGTITSSGVTGQKGFVLVVSGLSQEPIPGTSIQFANTTSANDTNAYVISSVSGTYADANSNIVLVLSNEKQDPTSNGEVVNVRSNFSQIRLTGHDFLDIGTGNTVTANVGGIPTIPASQGNEVIESKPGRVYYVSTDQNGNFRVGEYFRIDQATGRATLDASAFDLAGLTSLKLGSIGAQLGETINEFSSDTTLGGDSNQAVPTEHAVKTYVDSYFASDRTITGTITVQGSFEKTNVVSSVATGTIDYDVKDQTVIYYSANSTADWTLNIRGDANTTLDDMMDTGKTLSVAFLSQQGAGTYWNNVLQIDGSARTINWQGGVTPTAGSSEAVDSYIYTIIKTAANTYTILGAQTKFS